MNVENAVRWHTLILRTEWSVGLSDWLWSGQTGHGGNEGGESNRERKEGRGSRT